MAEPTKSYEEAREELETIVRTLESGGVSLAETVALWEQGEKAAAVCQEWLSGAKAKIDAARAATASQAQ